MHSKICTRKQTYIYICIHVYIHSIYIDISFASVSTIHFPQVASSPNNSANVNPKASPCFHHLHLQNSFHDISPKFLDFCWRIMITTWFQSSKMRYCCVLLALPFIRGDWVQMSCLIAAPVSWQKAYHFSWRRRKCLEFNWFWWFR